MVSYTISAVSGISDVIFLLCMQVEADDMADLRDACDGQNSCNSYRVLGGPLSECDGLRQAQYMQVYHKCLPGKCRFN